VCGITGFWSPSGVSSDNAREILEKMTSIMSHRGPDDSGIWIDAPQGLALGHRRLSVLDLSPAGHQPMISAGQRFVIVFNGEIYNHRELRAALAEEFQLKTTWRGHSDTETLLVAFEYWGVEKTLKKTVGMFAFALWDQETKTLTLARDRMGEKPLYYGWQKGTFVFGSELKALRKHPEFLAQIDRDALSSYFRYGYIPTPLSIFIGIHKLSPGHYLVLKSEDAINFRLPLSKAYWSIEQAMDEGYKNPFKGDILEASRYLESLLIQSIRGQMLADVSVGAFLSGGVDSSTVVALMQAQSHRPVKTFTVGFHEKEYNEAQHAQAVASHLGCDHTELYVTSAEAMEVIPRLPSLYDEPFADASQIPTFLVSQLARKQVTVSLSGDGGDELFGGYTRYFLSRRLWNKLKVLPIPLRKSIKLFLTVPSKQAWNNLFEVLNHFLPQELRITLAGDKINKLSELLSVQSPEECYRFLVSYWKDPAKELVIGAKEPENIMDRADLWPILNTFEEKMMYFDQRTYLPDDILVKVDRAAMGVSLETRVPFLDHRIVEFAWRLPLDLKIRGRQGKYILRQVLYRYVPQSLIERPKMGFGVPIDHWLKESLRDWAEELLDENSLKSYVDPAPIRKKWDEHLSNRGNWQYLLWTVLMWESWRRENNIL
jgi:asparagine synthase (glutamine-hydrolysing)